MDKDIHLADHSQCTGCKACSNVCPTGSIDFVLKEDLHYYPNINTNSCIGCLKCERICPVNDWHDKHISNQAFTPVYYCAWSEDRNERYQATSGGVGGTLALHALNNGYYICGAVFNSNWELHHEISNDKSIIEKVRGSKYLQSDTDGIYKDLTEVIKKGNHVLFIGTPCQTDAVRQVIPPHLHNNLLTCEIICHGINSPEVWKDYKDYLESKEGSNLKSYNFRSKSKGWGKLRVKYVFNNGHSVDKPAWQNIYHRWFGQHYMMRESCFRCPYRTEKRYSDMVIGDFWGIETIEPNLNVKEGASVLIAQTERGYSFIKDCSLYKKEIDRLKALTVLKGFVDKMPESEKNSQIARMKKFTLDYSNYSFKEMALKCYPPITLFDKVKRSLLYHLHITK